MPEKRLHPKHVNPEQSILLHGGPREGFEAYGPFDETEDAADYAEKARLQDAWWVMPLTQVQCDDYGNWVFPEQTNVTAG